MAFKEESPDKILDTPTKTEQGGRETDQNFFGTDEDLKNTKRDSSFDGKLGTLNHAIAIKDDAEVIKEKPLLHIIDREDSLE